MKKMYRSETDRKIAGVLGGLADYLAVDANALRLLTVLIFFITGFFPVLITYIVAWVILPEESEIKQNQPEEQETSR